MCAHPVTYEASTDPKLNSRMHPDENDLARYVDGRLTDAERQDVEAHLADCPRCREQVAATYRYLTQETDDPPAVPPEIRRRAEAVGTASTDEESVGSLFGRRPLTIAAAILALLVGIGVLVWHVQSPPPSRLRSTGEQAALSVRAPADGATVSERPVFVCDSVADAVGYRVTLRRADGTVMWEEDTTAVRVSLPPDVSLEEGQQYLWRAEALRPDGSTLRSNVRTFTYAP